MNVLVFVLGLPLLALFAAWLWVAGTALLDTSPSHS
jgi:hypothetical protein